MAKRIEKLKVLDAPLVKDFLYEMKQYTILDFRNAKKREILEGKLNDLINQHVLAELNKFAHVPSIQEHIETLKTKK